MNITPVLIFVALIVLIFAIFVGPTIARAFRERPPRAYTELDREQRIEASAFFYALPPETLTQVRSLPDRTHKEAALRQAYAKQNPEAQPHEVLLALSTFFTLYSEEIGLQGGLYHRRANGKVQLGGASGAPLLPAASAPTAPADPAAAASEPAASAPETTQSSSPDTEPEAER